MQSLATPDFADRLRSQIARRVASQHVWSHGLAADDNAQQLAHAISLLASLQASVLLHS